MLKNTMKDLINFLRLYKKVQRGKGMIEYPLKLRGVAFICIGKNVKIRKNYRIECIHFFHNQLFTPELLIGEGVLIGNNFTAFVSDRMVIGEHTIIASYVTITTENHGTDPLSPIPFADQPLESKAVIIGSNVWIGQNVIILPGVTVGDNSVIAAGSIVTKNVESMTIVAGNPARVIKRYDVKEKMWKRI